MLARVDAALAVRPRRILGLPAGPEHVGVVVGREFEMWERRRQAVHLLGRVTGRRGGSRLELRTTVLPRARLLIAIFFALFALLTVGVLAQPGRSEVVPVVAVAAAAACGTIFYAGAVIQRRQLIARVRAILDDVLVEP